MNDSIDVANEVADSLSELTDESQESVPGAKFKAFLLRKYNNPDHPVRQAMLEQRFGALLRNIQDRIALKWRYGSDFLAVPKGKEHLFSSVGKDVAIRQDLFRAFSYFSAAQLPYYDRTTDKVTSFEDPPEDRELLVAIPPRAIEAEIELRKRFAREVADPKISDQLLKDLNIAQRELTSFSWTIRSHGCQGKWYAFRNRDVRERISEWATSNGVQWNENWIEERAKRYSQKSSGDTAESEVAVTDRLLRALNMLSDEDRRRISVPLDIVLRFLDKS